MVYDPQQPLSPHVSQYDHMERIAPAPSSPIDVSRLLKFMGDAFHPLADPPTLEPFGNFVTLPDAQKGYVKSLKQNLQWISKVNNVGNEVRMLDLASGHTPVLRTLFWDHEDQDCSEEICKRFRHRSSIEKLSYVAVDRDFPEGFVEKLREIGIRFQKCFPLVDCTKLDLNNAEDLDKLDRLYSGRPFRCVVLANAWHELSTSAGHELLARIPNLLEEDGYFIFLDISNVLGLEDLDNAMKRYRNGTCYWESNAVYATSQLAENLICATGLEYHIAETCPDKYAEWWYVIGKKGSCAIPPLEERIDSVRTCWQHYFKSEHSAWLKSKSREIRDGVIRKWKHPSANIEDVLFDSLRYLCLCASHSRYAEDLQ